MKKFLPSIIIILISLLFFTLLWYFQGYENKITCSLYYGILKAICFVFFWFGAIKFILRLNWYGPLGSLLVPVFWYVIASCLFFGNKKSGDLYCKLRKNDGYYIIPAVKQDFKMLCEFGWRFNFLIDNKLLFECKTEFVQSSDTILIGIMKEAKINRSFTFKKYPTHEEIEHAKQGWYMEGDTEKPLNKYAYTFFKAIILKQDSINKVEASKPIGKWAKYEQNKK